MSNNLSLFGTKLLPAPFIVYCQIEHEELWIIIYETGLPAAGGKKIVNFSLIFRWPLATLVKSYDGQRDINFIQGNFKQNMLEICLVSMVPADDLVLLGTRPSAGAMMSNFESIII